jgi:hypothetical protein
VRPAPPIPRRRSRRGERRTRCPRGEPGRPAPYCARYPVRVARNRSYTHTARHPHRPRVRPAGRPTDRRPHKARTGPEPPEDRRSSAGVTARRGTA